MSTLTLEDFRNAFKGDIVVPSDSHYPQAIARWSVSVQKNAKIVAFVKDADDIVLAIKFAKEHKYPIAVRGGGHEISGANSVEGGLVIDLSRHLNGVKVDPERKVAIVGGGALWETVDKAAIEHGLATVGGTINHTGVGGLLLGGGYGYLSARHGLVIDNLVQATVVTADGSVLAANETENADLFWAIRGGGGNFGVCPEFVLRLHPQRRTIFAGRVILPPPALDSLTNAVKKWWEDGPSENETVYQIATRGPDGNPFVGVFLVYNGPEEEGRTVFKPFFDLKPIMETCKEVPYEELNALNNDMTKHGQYHYIKGLYEATPHPEVVAKEFNRMVSASDDGEIHFMVFHEYIPPTKICSVASDATAFCHRKPKGNILVVTTWDNDTEKKARLAKEATHEILSFSDEVEKLKDNIGYGNYNGDDKDTGSSGNLAANKSKAHFGANYPRLQRLKKQYDPDLLFNRWFAIVPA